MKRDSEQEEDLSKLLQFLDDEAAGPSNDGDNQREPELEPKHTIFLSHSGVQKNFTEQLCVDLERSEYSPFFDKRPDSLPKGKKFPELIFQAAQQCRVAILVLSEDFFTRTKWPMLELEAFVQSQKEDLGKLAILPVYLGLSRNECTRNERRQHWLSVWRGWAQNEDRIDVGKWEDALKVLGPLNGIEYEKSLGEVGLREQIVSAVRRLIPPESSWNIAHVQGRTRILKAIMRKLVSTKPSPFYGVRVVGIYGMGGIGKTTFCRVLCDELQMKFEGKVCHAELGSKKKQVKLHKEVLRRLTDVNHESLMVMNEDMTMDLLRRRIRQQRVLLALDNVWQESLEQAKDYLRAGFHHGSIVMVTARSIDILGRLNIDQSDCLEMPDLEEEDAKQLFLRSAIPHIEFISEGDESKIQYCIKQCRFRKGANMEEHFHPLALKVLGAQLGSLGCDPSLWVENLSKDDKFNHFREKESPIFKILRKGYDSLCEEDQLLFMDAILFHPSQRKSPMTGMEFVTKATLMHHIFRLDIYNWLSIVHDLLEVRFIKDRLQALKAKSLIEDVGDGFNGVIVHDLYLEFAKSEVKRGALDARRWVWYDTEATYPADLAKRPSGNCWSNVERISVKYAYDKSIPWLTTMEGLKWQQFSNVVVLQLYIGRNEVLDLRGLQCLKSMELRWNHEGCEGYKSGGQLIGLGELRNLAWLDMHNLHFAPCFQEIGQLTRLEVLRLDTNCFYESPHSEPLEPPNLEKCTQLQELLLECACLVSFPDLSKLTSLRKILFHGCRNAKELRGLSSQMTSLEELLLFGCDSLSHCPGLGDVVSLQQLDVQGCSQLSQIPDLHKLAKLRRLNIRWSGFKKLLGFNDSMQLQELLVNGSAIDVVSNLHLLRHLQRLDMRNFKPTVLPWFDNFIALEELILIRLPEVKDMHGMRSLTRLKRLTITGAPNLLQLPELGDLMALQYLCLRDCCRLVGKLELPNLHNLINLEFLMITSTPIRRLPSLERLIQLRELRCPRTLLAELPDLNGLVKLECIQLSNCRELTSLEKLGTLPALIRLEVSSCDSLTRLPDLRSFRSLEHLDFCHSGVSLGPEDMRALTTLPALDMWGWHNVKLRLHELLEKMSLMEVVMHLEAEQLEYFTTLQTRTQIDLESWPEK